MRPISAAATLLLGLTAWLVPATAAAAEPFITVASTTSTEQSGLFKFLLPKFESRSGVRVRVLALGTGQALDTARRGDADVVFVHAKSAEERFVAEGYALKRQPVMYNDFILVGPTADPASVRGLSDIVEALRRVSRSKSAFVSRGDRSGTHMAELELWKLAGIEPSTNGWYRDIGQGMGQVLSAASSMNAYALTDRGTWIVFANRSGLALLVEGDKRLFNQYGVMLVNPARHPHVKHALGQKFVDWLTGPDGQNAIADYKVRGQQLFFPNAGQPGA
jgi:tungstate transport system substrate-binding protein